MSTNSKVTTKFGDPIPAKTDKNNRFWRELRCLNCRHWFGDEYIRDGRIRLKCPKSYCGKITIMEFHSNRKDRSPSKKLNNKENATNE